MRIVSGGVSPYVALAKERGVLSDDCRNDVFDGEVRAENFKIASRESASCWWVLWNLPVLLAVNDESVPAGANARGMRGIMDVC